MNKRDQAGFTLIELVVAMAFIGIVMVSIYDLFVGVKQLNIEANNATNANEIAQQIMEQYRNIPFSNITVGTQDYSSLLTPYPGLRTPRSASATVTQVDSNGLDEVDINLSYTDRTGLKQVQLVSLIANRGLNR